MPLLGTAALAIWHGIQAGGVPAFEQYHTLEHMPERLGIPGFLRGRRYRGEVDGAFHCFTLYETAHGEVLRSPPYLARLNAPTDWTQRIQPTMTGFLRGACDVQCSLGLGVGAAAGTWRLAGTPHASACAAAKPQQPVPVNSPAAAPLGAAAAALLAGTLMMQPGVCGAHVLRHRPTVTSQATGETALRPSTSAEHFDALLVLEAIEIGYLREAQHAVAQAVAAAGLAIAGNGRGALYHLGYQLEAPRG